MDPHFNEGLGQGNKAKKSEGPWTPVEDDTLRHAITSIHGPQALQRRDYAVHIESGPPALKWSDISDLCFQNNCRREAKQCRERYVNHLDPNLDPGALTNEQVKIVLEWVPKHGKKWAQLGRILGKAENAVKNQWYQHHKKTNRVARQESESPRRNVPQDRLLPDPTSSYITAHSRRESTASSFSNPGMISDAGSPADSLPSSPYGPHAFPGQLSLPQGFAGSCSSPRSSYASSAMDRSFSTSSMYHEPSSYDQDMAGGYPMRLHHSERSNYNGSTSQHLVPLLQQQQSSTSQQHFSASQQQFSRGHDTSGYHHDQAPYLEPSQESHDPGLRQLEAVERYSRDNSLLTQHNRPRAPYSSSYSTVPHPQTHQDFYPPQSGQRDYSSHSNQEGGSAPPVPVSRSRVSVASMLN